MTEEEIKALVKTMLSEFSAGLATTQKTVIDAALAPITQQLQTLQTTNSNNQSTKETPKDQTKDDPEQKTTLKATVAALQQQLEDLKTQSANDKKTALQAEFKAELSNLLGSVQNLRTPGIVKDLLIAKWADKVLKGDDGQFIIKDGENVKILKTEFDGFFATDEGKALIGAKTPKPTDTTVPKATTTSTVDTSNNNSTKKTSLDLFSEYTQQLQASRN